MTLLVVCNVLGGCPTTTTNRNRIVVLRTYDIFAAGPQSHSIRTISRAAWYELHLTWDKIKRIINLIQAEFGINRSDKFIVRYKCYNCDVLMKLNVFMET